MSTHEFKVGDWVIKTRGSFAPYVGTVGYISEHSLRVLVHITAATAGLDGSDERECYEHLPKTQQEFLGILARMRVCGTGDLDAVCRDHFSLCVAFAREHYSDSGLTTPADIPLKGTHDL